MSTSSGSPPHNRLPAGSLPVGHTVAALGGRSIDPDQGLGVNSMMPFFWRRAFTENQVRVGRRLGAFRVWASLCQSGVVTAVVAPRCFVLRSATVGVSVRCPPFRVLRRPAEAGTPNGGLFFVRETGL